MSTEENKTEEQKDKKRRASLPSFGHIIVESVWNAITWLPVIVISKMIDDD
jgi:hypothetical protein